MKVEFDKSFSKSIDKLKNKRVKLQIIKFIEAIENAKSLKEITSIKKMKGHVVSYRKKIGDYRIGFEYNKSIITFIIVAHRKDIYNMFP